jgi:hypothetical protein
MRYEDRLAAIQVPCTQKRTIGGQEGSEDADALRNKCFVALVPQTPNANSRGLKKQDFSGSGVFQHRGNQHHPKEPPHAVLVGRDPARRVEVGPEHAQQPLDQKVDVDVVP